MSSGRVPNGGPEGEAPAAPSSRRALLGLAALFAIASYGTTLNGVAAPYLARSFGLDDAAMARMFGWIALNGALVLWLARLLDRLGRRRILRVSILGLAAGGLATAGAPTLFLFVVAQIGANAFLNTTITAGTVMVTEELSVEQRARGQSMTAFLGGFGSGVALLLVASLSDRDWVWRLGWGLLAVPLLVLLRHFSALPETRRWQNAAGRGEVAKARARDAWRGAHRPRTAGLVLHVLLGSIAGTASGSWPYYHLVHALGMSASTASVILFTGGAAGMAGFFLAGRFCDRFGRRATLAAAALTFNATMVAFYLLPDIPTVWLPLGLLFGLASIAGNASIVAFRTLATELFPTRIRSTVMGWFSVAGLVAAVASNFATGALTEVTGSLAEAIAWIALLIVPACLALLGLVPETRGLALEEASLESSEEPAG